MADIVIFGGTGSVADPDPVTGAAAVSADARLSFVGGAGTSLVAPDGPRLLDTPEFQDEWRLEAVSHAEVLAALQEHDGLRWFHVSPAALVGSWALGETLAPIAPLATCW